MVKVIHHRRNTVGEFGRGLSNTAGICLNNIVPLLLPDKVILRMFTRISAKPASSPHPLETTAATGFRRLVTAATLALGAVMLAACGGDAEPVTSYGGLDSCVTDPAVCNTEDLCRLAIFDEDNVKRWNDDNLRWQPYVKEAQSRGLTCGL